MDAEYIEAQRRSCGVIQSAVAADTRGLFLITKAYNIGAFRLANLDDDELANPINHLYLKPYYI